MKNRLSEIRGEVNILKAKLGDLCKEVDVLIIKYTTDKLGYKEFKRQNIKLLKEREIIMSEIESKILEVEEMENGIDKSDGIVIKMVSEVV